MTEPVIRIQAYQTAFATWAAASRLTTDLKRDLLKMTGIEQESRLIDDWAGFDFSFVKINLEELAGYGTTCGRVPNYCFTPEVLEFLAAQGVDFILGISENTALRLQSAAIHFSSRAAAKLERMILVAHGSLRPDPASVRGWQVFESE